MLCVFGTVYVTSPPLCHMNMPAHSFTTTIYLAQSNNNKALHRRHCAALLCYTIPSSERIFSHPISLKDDTSLELSNMVVVVVCVCMSSMQVHLHLQYKLELSFIYTCSKDRPLFVILFAFNWLLQLQFLMHCVQCHSPA